MLKNILVTGGSGLIGSHLINELSRGDYKIFVAGRSSNDEWESQNISVINIDFSKEWDDKILPEKIDAVIHLSQSEHFREFPGKATEVFYVNTLSTLKLINYALNAGASNFIYASSAGIYGNNNDGFNEEQEIVYKNELGFYLGTKHCSEVILDNYMALLNVITLRFFFVYGPGQRKDMLIPRLVGFVKQGQPITLQGEEGIRINPTHVTDAVNAIISALKLDKSSKINVAGPEILSLREIGQTIGKTLGIEPKFICGNDKEEKNLIGDISKMARLLAPPKIKFSEGLNTLL